MKNLKYIIILFLCLIINVVHAQEEEKQKRFQLEIGGFYGYSGVIGKIANGNIEPQMEYHLSATGIYYFTKSIGFGTGIFYTNYFSKASLDNYSANIPSVDDENETFEYRISGSNISEDINISAIEIPVFIAFKIPSDKILSFTSKLGIVAILPQKADFKCTQGITETRGYYESYNVEFYDMPNHGFERIDNLDKSGDLVTQTAFSVFADFGMDVNLGKIGLNIGIYGSYSLTPIFDFESSGLILYPNNYQSIFSITEDLNAISAGIRLGLFF